MKIIVALLIVANLYLFYTTTKQKAWMNLIAKNYMLGNYYQAKCNKDVIVNNRLPIIERVLNLRDPLPEGSKIDWTLCEKSMKQWDVYYKAHSKYLKRFRW